MTDQFHEQISEFIDDEMSVEESEFFVRRLQRDESARRQYLRYQLIGAAVRGEYRHPGVSELGPRLEQALDHDEGESGQSRARWVRLASVSGIAASIALVAIFGFMALEPDAPATGAASASLGDEARSQVLAADEPASMLVVRTPDRTTGIQYMMHHARYSSGMFRTIAQSNVVAAQETALVADFEGAAIE